MLRATYFLLVSGEGRRKGCICSFLDYEEPEPEQRNC